jgi:hypothetical protein
MLSAASMVGQGPFVPAATAQVSHEDQASRGKDSQSGQCRHASTRPTDHVTFFVNPCLSLPGLCETLRTVRTAQTRPDHPRIMRVGFPARSISCKSPKSNLIARRAIARSCPIVAQPRSFIDDTQPGFRARVHPASALTAHRQRRFDTCVAITGGMDNGKDNGRFAWRRCRAGRHGNRAGCECSGTERFGGPASLVLCRSAIADPGCRRADAGRR